MAPTPLDLELIGLPGVVSAYLLSEPEPLLVDPGPSTTRDRLREGLAEEGVEIADLRHVLLTHIHLDHAGVTGHLAAENPDLEIHVPADGAPHLVDPTRLVSSTRRTFGDDHDRLWGEVRPVARERIRPWSPGDGPPLPGIDALPTPGHIDHHVAYLDTRSETLLAGDCMGIVLADDAPTHPPTPPPSLDLEAWHETLERLEGIDAERVAVAHFGIHGGLEERRSELRSRLRALEERVRRALAAGEESDAERYGREVVEEQARHLPPERAERYFEVFGASIDWRGVKFYLERHPHA